MVGVNGSGKSTLASYLAAPFSRALVLDTKGMDPAALIPGAQITYGVDATIAALRAGAARVVYRPPREEMAYGRDRRRRIAWLFDRVLEVLWAQGGVCRVVVHEIGDVADEDWSPPVLDETIRKGRFFDLTLTACTQTPNKIPMLLRSEAKHVFLYTLIDEGHRRVVAQYAGELAREILPMDRRFLHRGPRMVPHLHAPLG